MFVFGCLLVRGVENEKRKEGALIVKKAEEEETHHGHCDAEVADLVPLGQLHDDFVPRRRRPGKETR